MATYFFDLYDGESVKPDLFGDQFTGLDEAADQAVGLIVDLARESIVETGDRDLAVSIRSHAGLDVYWASLMFRDSSSRTHGLAGGVEIPRTIASANPVDIIQQSRTTMAAMEKGRQELEAALCSVSQTFLDTMETLRRLGPKPAVA